MTVDLVPDANGPELPADLEARFFALWLDQPDAQRLPALQALCSEFPSHAAVFHDLVARLDRSDSVLAGIRSHAPTGDHPERIGLYVIQEAVGQGGFGIVYRAEQTEPVQRTVAIKLLHPGRLGPLGLARFANEQQTLAVMDHPCIARVFDAGTSEHGQPYFVMEFVAGEPITKFCDRNRATIGSRLRLFTQVCDAIDHAHQKGIVHRDLKPANVLVSAVNDVPLPRVIDFGIAKILSEHPGHSADSTVDGSLLGTPEYMSPEQARSQPVGVRTDVYALGLMLFELLVDDLPFSRSRLRTGNLVEIGRIIAEEEPRRLSAVLERAPGSRAEGIAARRRIGIRQLHRELRSDIEWILSKCLEKDPARRYGSVSELTADIARFRNHEAVEARQPALNYLTRKFVRRHRVGVAVAGLVTLACLLGVMALVWALVMVDKARMREVAQRSEAELHGYAAHVGAAKLSFDAGAIGNARRHLLDAQVGRRGWEWRHVHALCDGGDPRIATGPMPRGLGWLSEQRLILGDLAKLEGDDRVPLQVWDVERAQRIRTIECFGVRATWANPERGYFVTSSRAGIELWQTDTGKRIAMLLELVNEENPWVLAGNAQRNLIAFGDLHGVIRVIELDGEYRVRTLGKLASSVRCLAFAETSGQLLAGGTTLTAFDIDDGTTTYRIEERVEHMQINPSETTVFVSAGHDVHAVDLATGERSQTFATEMQVGCLTVSADGQRLFVAGGWADGFVSVFDTQTGQAVHRLHGHERGVNSIVLSPNGERLATVSSDRTMRIWSSNPEKFSGSKPMGYDARTLSRSPSGKRLASAALDGSWRIWDTSDMSQVAHGSINDSLYACTLNEAHLYAIGQRLHLIEPSAGNDVLDPALATQLQPTWTSEHPFARDLLVDPNNQWLAAMSYDRLMVWSLPLATEPWVFEAPFHIHCLAHDPQSANLVVGCADGLLRCFNPTTGELRQTIAGLGPSSPTDVDTGATGALPIYRIAFHGDRIATACADGKVRVIDRNDSQPAMVLRGHEVIATGVAFSPDGSRIVSSGGDGYVRIWETGSGIDLLPLRAQPTVAQDVHFSADGGRIFTRYHTWGTQTSLQWWDAPPAPE